MGRKTKISYEEKLRAITDYLSGQKSGPQICLELQIYKKSFYEWLRKYQLNGEQGLQSLSKNKSYLKEIKLLAVLDYTQGLGSLDQISSKYDIAHRSILIQWIKKYNGHETTKSRKTQGDKFMIKGRKTTYEEKVEIVAFCIANNGNYQLTCDRFQVSYQQVYTWVNKYKEQGPQALIDNRGKRKEQEELSESQIVAAQLKLLEAENRRLKMENDFLKKLNEVERRR